MANLLTGLRLLLVAPAALAFARAEFLSPILLVAVVMIAIVTDYFDGIVARRRNTASPRGQVFDHSADFLFVTSGLAGAAMAGHVTAALPILIVVAFSQYVLDSHFLYREKQLHMSLLGAWNGILYFVPLVLISVARLEFMAGAARAFSASILILSYLLLLSTVASIIDRALAPLRAHQGGRQAQPWLR
jgi:phosphatidylglycerophosphate synthase